MCFQNICTQKYVYNMYFVQYLISVIFLLQSQFYGIYYFCMSKKNPVSGILNPEIRINKYVVVFLSHHDSNNLLSPLLASSFLPMMLSSCNMLYFLQIEQYKHNHKITINGMGDVQNFHIISY